MDNHKKGQMMDRIDDFFRQHPRLVVAMTAIWWPALFAGLFWLRYNSQVGLAILAIGVVVHLGLSLRRHAAELDVLIVGGLEGMRHAFAATVSCWIK